MKFGHEVSAVGTQDGVAALMQGRLRTAVFFNVKFTHNLFCTLGREVSAVSTQDGVAALMQGRSTLKKAKNKNIHLAYKLTRRWGTCMCIMACTHVQCRVQRTTCAQKYANTVST